MAETLAAVDVGTNSLHLVVARTVDGERFEVLTRDKDVVRLGSGSTDMDELSADAIDRAVVALERYRRIADSLDAPVRAVATSAVREAKNRDVFLRRAEAEAGVHVEVVSGTEEARLIHLGVLQALDVFDRKLLLFDIGGGSTELLLGWRGEVLASTSVKLGAVRLTNRFFAGDKLHPSAVESCRRHVREVLASFEKPVRTHGFDVAVGCSGTIEQVARLARSLVGEGPLRTLNAATVTRAQVAMVTDAVVEARRAGTVAALPDLDAKRSDIILAGVLVLEGVIDRFGIEEVTISDYALREGVFLDTIARRRGGSVPELRQVARGGVLDLLRSCDEDPDHAIHVAHLALELFDGLHGRLGLGPEARPLLEAAALLANVGLVVSHSQHHKHAYYVIRNSDRLVGFTDGEIELVALIARYHRKSAPKASHAEWAALSAPEQALVRACAGLLRVAIGLDRSHSQLVRSVTVTTSPASGQAGKDRVVVTANPAEPGGDLTLERYAAAERAALLSNLLDSDVEVVVG